jgi:hypothetical protein
MRAKTVSRNLYTLVGFRFETIPALRGFRNETREPNPAIPVLSLESVALHRSPGTGPASRRNQRKEVIPMKVQTTLKAGARGQIIDIG